MTKILFVNPAIRESDVPKHMPLGELTVAACCEKWAKADTALLDLNAMRSVLRPNDMDKETVAAVESESWDFIGVGGITTTYNSIKHFLRLARPLSDAVFLLGGGGFTAQPTEWMTWLPEVDIGVFGEAVQTVPALIQAREWGYELPGGVNGVWYRKNGKISHTVERAMIKDMDILPLAKYELAPMDIYFKNSSILLSEESMTAKRRLDYAASIGCLTDEAFVQTNLGLLSIRDACRASTVHAYDVKEKNETEATILGFQDMGKRRVIEIVMEDGERLEATPDHQFYTRRGWVRADALLHDDEVAVI